MNKTLSKILLTVAAVATVASCEITRPEKEITPAGDLVLTARLEAPVIAPETRTALKSDTSTVVWSSGDAFALIGSNGSKSRFTIASGVGSSSASFSGTASGTAPWYALYPDSDDVSLADGALHFKLPATQLYASGSFASGAAPAIAKMAATSDPLQFKNLCGLLCLQFMGPSVTVTKIVLHDLGGNMLWGDCTVALDGKEGTAEQTMTLTGGDNTLTLNIGSTIKLSASTSRPFFFVVPAGSFDRGFSVVVYTTDGDVYGVVQTQKPNIAGRSQVVVMEKLTVPSIPESSNAVARGYYKDLFMDGGIGLTSRTTLPAADYLKLNWEFYASLATGKTIAIDTATQTAVFIGSDEDKNGNLLYPDGEPRFRCIYVNGGKSTQHGASLGEDGRNRIRTYYAKGGGYVGTCAGCLISSKGYDSYATTTTYFGIWPGHTYHTKTDSGVGVADTYTSMTIEPGSALLNYYNYGNDMQIDGVRHNGGCYMGNNSTYPVPAGTEILLRYLTPGPDSTKLNGQVSSWAYKASEESGRLVVIGSHPEGVSSGEQRDLFSAMIRYASDGNGCVTPKGNLTKGVLRQMNKGSEQNSPAFAPIGDKQYHHFNFTLPADTPELVLSLHGIETNTNLYLALAKGRTAWLGDADYVLCSSGSSKSLHLRNVPAGTWSVAVYCPVTVTATKTEYTSGAYYFKYSGNLEVLNGVPYEISVNWGSSGPNAGTGTNQPAVPVTGTWD